MMVDAQREQVYAAELAAFDGTDLETVVGLDVIRHRIEQVVAQGWWSAGAVHVVPMRRDAHSSATSCLVDGGGVAEIRIAPRQATVATATHELAHVLAGVDHGHDARYRRAHLDVVGVMTNPDRIDPRGDLHVNQLTDAYRAAGLPVGSRRWSPPSVGGAIAL